MRDKTALRKTLMAQRKTAHQGEGPGPIEQQRQWLAEQTDGKLLAAYQPIRTERDPRPLLPEGAVAYPKVPGPDQALLFYKTLGPQDFVLGAFDVMEPLQTLPLVRPDVVLVPMVGFDAQGYRIGYGGGFYDRTLARLNAVSIGFAYDGQLSDQPLNFEPTDLALDFIMTPKCLYDFTGAAPKASPWS